MGMMIGRVVLVAAACSAMVVPQASAQAADATGRWVLSVATPEGPHTAVLTLAKSGEALTGTIAGAPGEFAVKGTQKGTNVVLSFTMPRDDGPMLITLTGSQSGDAVKGTVTFGTESEGTWTGTRGGAAPTAGGAAAADVSGTWALEVATGAGSGTPTMTLKQEGETVTGTYRGQLGEAPVTGTLKGQALTLSFDVTVQDTALKVVYTGTVTGDTMSGTVKLGDFGEGTFKGRRQPRP